MTNLDKLIKKGCGYVTINAISEHYNTEECYYAANDQYLSNMSPKASVYFEGSGKDFTILGCYYYGDEISFTANKTTKIRYKGKNLFVIKI